MATSGKKSAPAHRPHATSAGPVCPVCESQDSVQSVQTIIDSGVGTTTGGALSAPISGHGGLTVTGFSSQSVSRLAHRLSPYQAPNPGFWAWFFLSLLGCVLLLVLVGFQMNANSKVEIDPSSAGGILIAQIMLAEILGIIPAIIVSVIVGVIVRSIRKVVIRRKVEIWSTRASRLLSAFYCFRDDTMFGEGIHGKPEEFKRLIFTS